ncbi:MAG: SF1B family DNA helicase RecD2 [Anaerolineales bacterium]
MEPYLGTVTRIVYHNDDTGYTVLRLALEREGRKSGRPVVSSSPPPALDLNGPQQLSLLNLDALPRLVTVVGTFAGVEAGQPLRVSGEWMEHSAYGPQLKADKWEVLLPTSVYGIQTYLASGVVKGIGPALAEALVRRFKEHTFDVIDRMPQRLRDVPGIGEGRLKTITQAWQEHQAVRQLMTFLQGHGLSPALAFKLYKTFGVGVAQIVQTDPYRLTEARSVGFHMADALALRLGTANDSPLRLSAGVLHVLGEAAEQGNSYQSYSRVLAETAALLNVPFSAVATALEDMALSDERLHVDRPAPGSINETPVYLHSLYQAEEETARHLTHLAQHKVSALAAMRAEVTEAQIIRCAALTGQAHLSEEQRLAFRRAIENKVSVITGGPGTGKTMCLRTLVTLLELYRHRCVLVSPTGRAARRLAEATGHDAHTIHRLLKYSGSEFSTDEIDADVVVVDEASMMDLIVMKHLLRAVRPEAHLVLVGDVDQLPAVGVGTVLNDVINSGLAAVTRLTHVFRQAQSSLIIANAHRIRQGQAPLTPQRECDFYLFNVCEADQAADMIVDIATRRIAEQFGASLNLHDPLRDVQVLAPMYKGAAGVDQLNARLQAALNPPAADKAERALPRGFFRVGDKVMFTRNDYDREVSNGDLGFVTDIDRANQEVSVECEGRRVVYEWNDLDDLIHAYAVSVHKSQGAEYPAVVMPILPDHHPMLYRELLYTAVTRARRLCVLVGSRAALEQAVQTCRGPERLSGLLPRLQALHA